MPKRRFRSTGQIRKILNELTESGLSQREFALKRNIALSTLSSWLRKHRRSDTTAGSAGVIPVGTISDPPSVLEIEFPGGEVLRIDSGCRSEDLRRVLTELRRC